MSLFQLSQIYCSFLSIPYSPPLSKFHSTQYLFIISHENSLQKAKNVEIDGYLWYVMMIEKKNETTFRNDKFKL